MRFQILFAGICLFGLTVVGDEFYLRDVRSNQESGPFSVRRGAKVQAGGQDFEVSRIEKRCETVLERMERIVIPEIDFQNASLRRWGPLPGFPA